MLSKKLAQNIVDKMMEVIPYNVNIMNNKGIIIGSGDSSRIGSIHEGAVDALDTKETVEIFENHKYTKPGVNIPIFFRNEAVGVIGITGLPEVVRPFGQLVSITAELLISQEYSINEHIVKQKLIEEFIYEWINNKEYSEEFIQRGNSLGINVKNERIVVVIHHADKQEKNVKSLIKKFLKDGEYNIHISSNRIALILFYNNYIINRINRFKEQVEKLHIKIGVGRFNKIIMYSLMDAVNAINIGSKLYNEKIIYDYKTIKFFHEVNSLLNRYDGDNIIRKISDDGNDKELLQTFLTYMEMNGEKVKVSDSIHIHRNTLNYRLNKIEELTNLRFDNYLELYQLITAYIRYKLNS